MTPEKEWQRKFIERLAQTGNVSAACKRAKISRKTAYQTRGEDEEFNELWQEALEIATEGLELEARRRAERGVLEPVFYLGKKSGAIRKYSDTLLIFLLKAHKPDVYRDNAVIEHKGSVEMKVDHAIDGDTATTIFDILAAVGALPASSDDAKDDQIHTAQSDA